MSPGCGTVSTPKAFLCDFWTILLNKWLSRKFYWMHLGEIGHEGVRGLVTVSLLWLLKRALELLIRNPICLLRSLYDHPFYKMRICPDGITYNPWREGCEGEVVILKDIIIGPFKLCLTIWLSQNFDWRAG